METRYLRVADTESVAAHLVRVCRAYAFQCGAYLAFAHGGLIGGIQEPVRGQDEVRAISESP